MRLTTIISIVAVGAAVSVLGCGGGGGSSIAAGENRSPGSATVTIQWPKTNSRLIPSGTGIVKVTMHREVVPPEPDPPAQSRTAAELQDPDPTKHTVTFGGLTPGSWTMTAESYNGSTQTSLGTLLAHGSDTKVISPGQDTSFAIEMGSEITWVKVTASTGNTGTTTVGLGDQITLTASGMTKTPTDATSALVPVATSTQITFTPSSNALQAVGSSVLGPNKDVRQTFKANQMATGVTVNVTLTDPNDQNFSKTGSFTVDVVAPGYGAFREIGIPGTSMDVAADDPTSERYFYSLNGGQFPSGDPAAPPGIYLRTGDAVTPPDPGVRVASLSLADPPVGIDRLTCRIAAGGGNLFAIYDKKAFAGQASGSMLQWYDHDDVAGKFQLREQSQKFGLTFLETTTGKTAHTRLTSAASAGSTTIVVKDKLPPGITINFDQSTAHGVDQVAGTGPYTLTLHTPLTANYGVGSPVYFPPKKDVTRVKLDVLYDSNSPPSEILDDNGNVPIGTTVAIPNVRYDQAYDFYKVIASEVNPSGGYTITLDKPLSADYYREILNGDHFGQSFTQVDLFDFTDPTRMDVAYFTGTSSSFHAVVADNNAGKPRLTLVDFLKPVSRTPNTSEEDLPYRMKVTRITGFSDSSMNTVTGVAVDQGNSIYLSGSDGAGATVKRYHMDGTLDGSFTFQKPGGFGAAEDVALSNSSVFVISAGVVHVFDKSGTYIYSVGPKVGQVDLAQGSRINYMRGLLEVMAIQHDEDNAGLGAIYLLDVPQGSRAAPTLGRPLPLWRVRSPARRASIAGRH